METASDPVAQRYSGPNDNVVKYDPMWTTLWHRFSKNAVDTSGRMFAPRALLDYALPLPVSGTWRLSPSPETIDFSLVENEKGDFERCNFLMNYHLLFRRRTQIFVPEVWNDGSFAAFVQSQVVHPIICLINGLRSEETAPKVSSRMETCHDCDFPISVQILMERSQKYDCVEERARLPRILFYPPGSLELRKKGELNPERALSLPLFLQAQHKETTSLLITDFEHAFKVTETDIPLNVFHGETTSCNQQATLRYILASRITSVLPRGHFDLHFFIGSAGSGCLNDPSLPRPSDEEIFATYHRHSDFDRHTLAFAPDAIPQFLRWKERMKLRKPKDMEGDVISAISWAFSIRRKPFAPRYALEPLPKSTEAHLSSTRRTLYPQFAQALQKSARFTIVLEKELTPAVGTRFARTFSCRILQLDSQDIAVACPPQLCVKIYDDSTGDVEEYFPGHTGRGWFDNFYTENDMLQNEEDVYMRLRHAWGSALPFYYGSHLFACSDGQERYGILMELVPKVSKPLSACSESSQISFIRSARHAVRVLQYADVTQYDWSHNLDQLVVTPVQDGLNSQTLSCTLVDFGLARQGDKFYDVEQEDDYANMAQAITIQEDNEDGVPPSLMKQHFGPREPWDFLRYTLPF